MGNQWYNLNKWVRVIVTNNDIALISRYRQSKKLITCLTNRLINQ